MTLVDKELIKHVFLCSFLDDPNRHFSKAVRGKKDTCKFTPKGVAAELQ